MTTTTDRQDLQRALAMERALLAAAAQRAERHPLGVLLFDSAHPHVWVHNQLHVTGPAGDIDDLIRLLDDRYGQLAHRRAIVEDEVEGARLAEGFEDRGWKVERHLYMALRGPRDREPDAALAAEVSVADHQDIERLTMAEFPGGPEVRDELIAARALRREACDRSHCIAGVADGQRVGNTVVYVAGEVAQVEDVTTLAAFRGRGVARAMVSLACDLAADADADLIWLAADDDDWPKELYAKLGFRPIGRVFVFTRS